MATKSPGIPVHSLESIPCSEDLKNVIEYVVNNLRFYKQSQFDSIRLLPVNVKNRLLKKFTVTPYYLKNLEFHEALNALVNKSTTHIDLTPFKITDKVLDGLCICENLKEVYLIRARSDCNFDSKGLIKLLEKTHKLEILVIMRNSVVNDKVLEHISKNCPNLQTLEIGDCKNISDEGFMYLSSMNIKQLGISRTKITDKGLIALAEGKCGQTLQELLVNNCASVTNLGLKKIASCPNLNMLNFMCYHKGPDASIIDDVLLSMRPLKQVFYEIPF